MSTRLTRYNWIQIRMIVVATALAGVLGVVLWRAYELQMVQERRFDMRSDSQVKRTQVLTGRRGPILDRNGVELAVTVSKPSLYANPNFIKDVDAVMAQLAPILGDALDAEQVHKRLSSKRSKVYIARKIHPDVAEEVLMLGIQGVGLEIEHQRYYPLKDLGGHILGVVTPKRDPSTRRERDVGIEGAERTFDEQLKGKAVSLDMLQDAWRRRMYIGDSPDYTALEGNTVVLTIDERIQYIVETELAHAVRRFRAKSGTAVLTDPNTGQILAMATSTEDASHFNPNRRNDTPLSAMRNRVITDPFEPGSTFKPFVLAAALQEGLVSPGETIDTEGGVLKLGDYTIYDVYRAPKLKAWEVIKYSSNIGAYKIAKRLGKHKFGDYIQRFGFGQPTGVELHGESRGRVGDTGRWSDRILASAAYGYGLMVTNLQLNMALGAIANGGNLMEATLVKEIRDREGNIVERFEPKVRRRVLDEAVARQVSDVMTSVLEEGGTGTRAALAYHKVGGKTGTARKVNPRTKRYDKSRIVGSFIGFAPAESPAMVLTVIMDQPRFGRGGGEVAAPVFKRVAEQALPLLNVFPATSGQSETLLERLEKAQREARPEEVAAAAMDRKSRLDRRRRARRGEREGGEEEERFEVPKYVNGVVPPALDTGSLVPMPSYMGMSLREVLRVSRERGHLVRVDGAGVVRHQWPAPGVFVGGDVQVRVRLESRDAPAEGLSVSEPGEEDALDARDALEPQDALDVLD